MIPDKTGTLAYFSAFSLITDVTELLPPIGEYFGKGDASNVWHLVENTGSPIHTAEAQFQCSGISQVGNLKLFMTSNPQLLSSVSNAQGNCSRFRVQCACPKACHI